MNSDSLDFRAQRFFTNNCIFNQLVVIIYEFRYWCRYSWSTEQNSWSVDSADFIKSDFGFEIVAETIFLGLNYFSELIISNNNLPSRLRKFIYRPQKVFNDILHCSYHPLKSDWRKNNTGKEQICNFSGPEISVEEI